MYKLGGENRRGVNISNFRIIFGRIMKKERKIQKIYKKNPKIQNFDPLTFELPNYEYSDSPCSRAPVYQIWSP